jgi:hypothetical protein
LLHADALAARLEALTTSSTVRKKARELAESFIKGDSLRRAIWTLRDFNSQNKKQISKAVSAIDIIVGKALAAFETFLISDATFSSDYLPSNLKRMLLDPSYSDSGMRLISYCVFDDHSLFSLQQNV